MARFNLLYSLALIIFYHCVNLPCCSSVYLDSWSKFQNFSRIWIADWANEKEREIEVTLNSTSVSEQCRESLLGFIQKLKDFDLNAIRMLDSSGKLPSGILHGSWSDLGSFEGCVALPSSQYCLAYSKLPSESFQKLEGHFRPHSWLNFTDPTFQYLGQYAHHLVNMNITTGLCLPKGCSSHEIASIGRAFLEPLKSGLEMSVYNCQTRDTLTPWSTGEIIAASVVLTVFGLNILGTLFPKTVLVEHFNVNQNFKKVFTSPIRTKFPCLNGIKALSMVYLTFGHILWGLIFNSYDNVFQVRSALVNPLGLLILLAPASLESLLTATGLEMMSFFVDFESKFKLLPFLLIRWGRFAIIIGWMICINILAFSDHVRVLVGGPFWYYIQASAYISESCHKNWLSHLLLVNHYFDKPDDWHTCLMADWYLECDFVYAILFLAVLIPYLNNRKSLAIFNSLVMILLGAIVMAVIFILLDVQTSWLPFNFITIEFAKFLVYIHSKPWAHLGPYFIGVLLAFALRSPKSKVPKKYVPLGWMFCILGSGLLLAYEIVINVNYLPISQEIQLIHGITYRLIWSLILSWLIYACHYQLIWTIMNKFISAKAFGVMSRVNLTAMFANFLVFRFNNATMISTINLSLAGIVFNIMLPMLLQTYLLSFIFTIMVDKPTSNLIMSLIRKSKPAISKQSTNGDNNNTINVIKLGPSSNGLSHNQS